MSPTEKEQLSEELSAYLDGELEPPRSLEIEALLTESREVRDLLHEHRKISRRLHELPRVTAPIDLTAMVRAQILSSPAPAPARRALPGATRIYFGITGAAAAILLLALSFWTFKPASRQTDSLSGPAPSTSDDLARAMTESGKDQRRWAKVTPDDLRALEALGYVGGGERDADELAKALDRADALADSASEGEPAPAMAVPAGTAGSADLRKSGETSRREIAAATPEAVDALKDSPVASFAPAVNLETVADKAAPLAAAPSRAAPLMQVTVQAPSAESFQRSVNLAQAVESPTMGQQAVSGDGSQSYAGAVPADSIAPLLQALEEESPDGVRITMSFAPREIEQVREIFRESAAPPVPQPEAGSGIQTNHEDAATVPKGQILFFQHDTRAAPKENQANSRAARSRRRPAERNAGASVMKQQDRQARKPLPARSQPARPAPGARHKNAPTATPETVAAQAQLTQQFVPGLLMPWMPPIPLEPPPQIQVISVGITILPPPANPTTSSRPAQSADQP